MEIIRNNARQFAERSEIINSLRYGSMRGESTGRVSKGDSMFAVILVSAIFFAITLL